MFLISPRRPRITPQYGIAINWGNPITRGMQICLVPASGFEAVNNTLYAPSAARVITPRGVAHNLTGSGSVLTYASSAPWNLTGDFSFLLWLDQAANSAIWRGMLAKRDGAASSPSWSFGMTNAGALLFSVFESGVEYGRSLGTISTTARDNAQYVITGGGGDGSALVGYQDGLQIGTNTGVGIATGDSNTSSVYLSTWHGENLAENFLGEYHAVMKWNRALSAAEVKSLYDNPYQVFRLGSANAIAAAASVPSIAMTGAGF